MKNPPSPKEKSVIDETLPQPPKRKNFWAKIQFAIGLLFGGWKGN